MLPSIEKELAELAAAGLRRELRTRSGGSGRTVTMDGTELLNFAGNDYLGMAHELANDAPRHIVPDIGATASRLVCGNHELHERFEAQLASFHSGVPTLLFSSGYAANVGVIPALASSTDDLIVSDALNHASIIDGCRLARGRVKVFPHGDYESAQRALEQPARRKLLVSESVFSMDGDCADLSRLAKIADEADAILVVDQAHAVGWAGRVGEGIPLPDPERRVQIATLGKSFGAAGAYVVAPTPIRDLLIHQARSFVFSTGPALPTVAAAERALEILTTANGDEKRRRLVSHMRVLRTHLADLDLLYPGSGHSPIFPVIAGDNDRAMAWSQTLWQAGIFIQGIRPPTVPRGTARLRITLSAAHTEADLERLCDAISDLS